MTKNSFKIWIEYNFGVKKELTEDEKQEVEACEFAMHLLIPTESINRYIDLMGGIEEVNNNQLKLQYLANQYGVPVEIMMVKIDYLIKQSEKHEKTK